MNKSDTTLSISSSTPSLATKLSPLALGLLSLSLLSLGCQRTKFELGKPKAVTSTFGLEHSKQPKIVSNFKPDRNVPGKNVAVLPTEQKSGS